jgi:histone deacetylase 11
MPRVVYTSRYNIGFLGLERLHPFDAKKYGRAWRCLRDHFGPALKRMTVRPPRPVRRDELLAVHTPPYLRQLKNAKYLAAALEVPPLRHLPHWMIDWRVLRPMRWATMGTVVAARETLSSGFAVNLSGGYHHAKPDGGEGFCIYNDIALAIHTLRSEGLLGDKQRVAYIDLDAHQGNGVCHMFKDDNSIFVFDMYNSMIYPSYDTDARERIDCDIRLTMVATEDEYHANLETRLPGFLDSISKTEPIGLAIYNAGTDVFADDPLGGLNVSAKGILRRDLFTVGQLRDRGVPTLMLLSGGYTRGSYQLVANSAIQLLETEEARK